MASKNKTLLQEIFTIEKVRKKKVDRKLNRRSDDLKCNKFVNMSFKRWCKERKKLKKEINITTRDGKSKTSEVIYHKFLPLFVLLM